MVKTLRKIDLRSNIPYYVQLKEIVLYEIQTGIWRNEETLPSHSELCDMFNVSKSVIRQSLKELENEGYIIQHRGKLTEIVDKKISGQILQRLDGTYKNMMQMGYYPNTKVLINQVEIGDESTCRRLQILPKSKLIRLERIRYLKEEPLIIIKSYIPYDLCPKIIEIDLTGKSLLEEIKREYGFEIVRSKRSIEAVLSDEHESNLLEIALNSPLLLYKSTSFIEDGRVLGTTKALYRGDRAKFEVEIGNFAE
ncbi:MAG: GntR family transcriptional regulator [Brevefilum sp.]|jgi:GntR family transcriptional regulator